MYNNNNYNISKCTSSIIIVIIKCYQNLMPENIAYISSLNFITKPNTINSQQIYRLMVCMYIYTNNYFIYIIY